METARTRYHPRSRRHRQPRCCNKNNRKDRSSSEVSVQQRSGNMLLVVGVRILLPPLPPRKLLSSTMMIVLLAAAPAAAATENNDLRIFGSIHLSRPTLLTHSSTVMMMMMMMLLLLPSRASVPTGNASWCFGHPLTNRSIDRSIARSPSSRMSIVGDDPGSTVPHHRDAMLPGFAAGQPRRCPILSLCRWKALTTATTGAHRPSSTGG